MRMKHIKLFEEILNENQEQDFYDESDLMELFSQNFIEEYFDKYYEITEEDAARMLNLWNYVDLDIMSNNLIKEFADTMSIKDINCNKTDLVEYITNKMKKVNFSFYELNDMSKKQLIKIITDEGEGNEFVLNYLQEDYEGVHPEDILILMFGKQALEDPEDLLYYLRDYLDKDEIINDARDRIDFDFKYEYLSDYICNSEDLQENLLELNPNTVEALFNIMDEERSIGNTYEFQKRYIEFKIKEKGISAEDVLPEVLKDIHDKYGLDSDIKNEYSEYTYLINVEKYNL